MYSLLVKLIFLAALIELGFSFKNAFECRSRQCVGLIERATHDVLHIEWKPISVWPEEAKRFK